MRSQRIEVVAGTVQIRGHQASRIEAILAPIGLTHLDTCDLGNGIALVGEFKRTREQVLLFDRLRREL